MTYVDRLEMLISQRCSFERLVRIVAGNSMHSAALGLRALPSDALANLVEFRTATARVMGGDSCR